eukprot:scaffold23787_cov29-Tisochrysis_lutea.AAC.6
MARKASAAMVCSNLVVRITRLLREESPNERELAKVLMEEPAGHKPKFEQLDLQYSSLVILIGKTELGHHQEAKGGGRKICSSNRTLEAMRP